MHVEPSQSLRQKNELTTPSRKRILSLAGCAMKPAKVAAVFAVFLFALNLAQAKPKKSNLSAAFENAHYVYVESMEGDVFKPGLYPEDRQAIFDMQERLRDWKRYALTDRREHADLVFVLRKGRIIGQQDHVGVGPRNRSPQPGVLDPGQPTQGQEQGRAANSTGPRGVELGAEAEAGPQADILRVYTLTPEGRLVGPIWSRDLENGLDGPSVQLLQQLKSAVDKAYPPQTAQQPPPPATHP